MNQCEHQGDIWRQLQDQAEAHVHKKEGTSEQGRKGRVCPIAQVTKHNFWFMSYVFTYFHEPMIW